MVRDTDSCLTFEAKSLFENILYKDLLVQLLVYRMAMTHTEEPAHRS